MSARRSVGPSGVRARVSIALIAIARRLFANTPVQRLPLTTAVMRRVFRFGYPDEEVEITFRGLSFVAPSADVTIVPGLVGGFYETIELDILEALAPGAETVVDVGGNIGVYACLAAARMPLGKVLSFEPVPANLAYLRRNVDRNELTDRVQIIECAVGDATGTQPIYLADSIGTHSLSPAQAGSGDTLTVSVTTLDAHLAGRRVDVLKIDVEGYEGHALMGARELLSTSRPALLVEFVPDRMAAAGWNPELMIDAIRAVYDHVFVIDEPRRRIDRISYDDLVARAQGAGNHNLVAVSRPEQLAAVRAIVG